MNFVTGRNYTTLFKFGPVIIFLKITTLLNVKDECIERVVRHSMFVRSSLPGEKFILIHLTLRTQQPRVFKGVWDPKKSFILVLVSCPKTLIHPVWHVTQLLRNCSNRVWRIFCQIQIYWKSPQPFLLSHFLLIK